MPSTCGSWVRWSCWWRWGTCCLSRWPHPGKYNCADRARAPLDSGISQPDDLWPQPAVAWCWALTSWCRAGVLAYLHLPFLTCVGVEGGYVRDEAWLLGFSLTVLFQPFPCVPNQCPIFTVLGSEPLGLCCGSVLGPGWWAMCRSLWGGGVDQGEAALAGQVVLVEGLFRARCPRQLHLFLTHSRDASQEIQSWTLSSSTTKSRGKMAKQWLYFQSPLGFLPKFGDSLSCL